MLFFIGQNFDGSTAPLTLGFTLCGLAAIGIVLWTERGRLFTARHLPPVVSLQYHFNGQGTVSPFVGAGVNYTTFFSEKTGGALAGSTLRLKDSWGLAAHAGVDVRLSERGALRLDMRWIDIDSTVKLDGQRLGSVRIDPLVYGAAYVFTF